jgi:hypothetical protein
VDTETDEAGDANMGLGLRIALVALAVAIAGAGLAVAAAFGVVNVNDRTPQQHNVPLITYGVAS